MKKTEKNAPVRMIVRFKGVPPTVQRAEYEAPAVIDASRPGGAGFTGCGKTKILSFRGVFFAEESLIFRRLERSEIPRFARNDTGWYFFRSLFSL
jgi:hypothetical protein